MVRVGGHTIPLYANGEWSKVVKEFPHMCPGDGCAIAQWLETQVQRERYDACPLNPKPNDD